LQVKGRGHVDFVFCVCPQHCGYTRTVLSFKQDLTVFDTLRHAVGVYGTNVVRRLSSVCNGCNVSKR